MAVCVRLIWYWKSCSHVHPILKYESYEATTLADLLNDWNLTLPERQERVREWNHSIEEAYNQGQMSEEAVLAAIEPVPSKVEVPQEKLDSGSMIFNDDKNISDLV